MPLVTKGFSGSFGMAFLFTVMWARPSTASASLPVMCFARRSTRNMWQSVRPETMRKPRSCSTFAITRALSMHLLLVDAELASHRFLERHGLGRDHVHQRPALDAGEDRS